MFWILISIAIFVAEVTTMPSRSTAGKAYHVMKPKWGHLASILPSIEIGTLQSIAAQGRLECNGKPAVGVKVKLYDEDRGLDLDDLLMEGETDSDGRFYLKGSTYEVTSIDPKVNVYHDCNDEKWPCLKKFSIVLPDSYITENSKVPKKTFDLGTINLNGQFSGESRDCLNRKK